MLAPEAFANKRYLSMSGCRKQGTHLGFQSESKRMTVSVFGRLVPSPHESMPISKTPGLQQTAMELTLCT